MAFGQKKQYKPHEILPLPDDKVSRVKRTPEEAKEIFKQDMKFLSITPKEVLTA